MIHSYRPIINLYSKVLYIEVERVEAEFNRASC